MKVETLKCYIRNDNMHLHTGISNRFSENYELQEIYVTSVY
jgi:hypothetical protein